MGTKGNLAIVEPDDWPRRPAASTSPALYPRSARAPAPPPPLPVRARSGHRLEPPPRPPGAHAAQNRSPKLLDPRLQPVWAADEPALATEPGRPIAGRLGSAVGRASAFLARPLRLAGIASQLAIYLMVWLALWAVLPALLPGWTSVAITSGSMAPALRPGDVVVAGPVDATLGPGAVVVFSYPPRTGLITHRIVAINPDGTYVTRGDANQDADSTSVTFDQMVGIGRLRIPFIGLPMAWYGSGNWTALGLWLGVTVLLMWLGRFGDRSPGGRDGA